MIPGIVAQGDGSADVGSGLIASADFVNGVYTYEEDTLAASDVVDDTGRISGSGLSLLTDTPVMILNQFLDRLLTLDWTIVIEVDAGTPVSFAHRLYLMVLLDPVLSNNEIDCYTLNLFGQMAENSLTNVNRFVDDNSAGGVVGINKYGYTRVDSFMAMSVNGAIADFSNDPITDTTCTEVQFASSDRGPGVSGYIRKLDIYASVLPAAMPALTAL